MEGRGIVSWTPENWLTIVLMVWVGFGVIGFVAHLAHKARAGSDG